MALNWISCLLLFATVFCANVAPMLSLSNRQTRCEYYENHESGSVVLITRLYDSVFTASTGFLRLTVRPPSGDLIVDTELTALQTDTAARRAVNLTETGLYEVCYYVEGLPRRGRRRSVFVSTEYEVPSLKKVSQEEFIAKERVKLIAQSLSDLGSQSRDIRDNLSNAKVREDALGTSISSLRVKMVVLNVFEIIIFTAISVYVAFHLKTWFRARKML